MTAADTVGKEHGFMPERQHTPGEVDAQRTEGSGGTSTDAASARRTDSPRGDALFAPSVEPATPEPRADESPAGATTVIPTSGAATPPGSTTPAGSTPPAGSTNPAGSVAPAGSTTAGPSAEAPTASTPAEPSGPTEPAVPSVPAGGTPATPEPATTVTPVTPASAATTVTPATRPAPGAAAAGAAAGAVGGAAINAQAGPTPDRAPEPTPGTAADRASDGAAERASDTVPDPATDSPADAAPGTAPAGAPDTAPADEQATAVQATPWSAEDTQVIPRAGAVDADTVRVGAPVDPPTQQIPAVLPGGRPPAGPTGPTGPVAPAASGSSGGGSRRRKPLLIVAGVVAVLGLAYVADLVISQGDVPRGVTVAGQRLGGLSKADATQRLQTEIEPRSSAPVQVTAGDVQSQVDPKAAGLEVDYQATIDQAGAQPLNPITRITSFFTEREVGVVNKADERSVLTALEQLKPVVDKAPVEGTVKFEGATPVAVAPVPGQQLDLQAAAGVLESQWASGTPVALPLIPQPTITTDEDVAQALQSVATPAVSAPVTIQGEGANATLAPTDIAGALTFRADAAASPKLVPEINNEALKDVATPQLASTETPGRDATLDFSSGAPVVVPSQDGRGVDYDKTFEGLVPVLTGSGARTVTAVYADQPAKLTTEQLGALGITGEISSFTTGGFAADSGQNIRRAAEQVNGTIVAPGETFSLNRLTNPRNAANGYVEAGIIENGHSARGIGGGVSQVATTLYNAAYFAGMVDVEHKEHSFYISRYPVAREATVFDDIIDLKFRNDGPTGVLVQTIWTPSSLTVKMFGTKRYEVTSETGPRTNPTEPQTLTLPAGQGCVASKGAPGFTATDTRVMRNVETGEVTRKTRTVKYNPSPNVVCQ